MEDWGREEEVFSVPLAVVRGGPTRAASFWLDAAVLRLAGVGARGVPQRKNRGAQIAKRIMVFRIIIC